MKYALKRDGNEKDIIKELRARGCFVQQLDKVDLLVGHKGIWHVIEVKDGDKKLTAKQVDMILEIRNRAPYRVARTVAEAVEIVFENK